MRIAFRADASLQIGSGHVMRCLTLADALALKGAECHFLCREHPGHLSELILGKGYTVHLLPCEEKSSIESEALAHATWLGATQEQDAQACRPILQKLQPDWLIVDHYGLDFRWEIELRSLCHHLMVIDDLADRPHQCDMLLDQNLGRQVGDYASLVPDQCMVLAGPQYALLRPEFAAHREYSLQRRKHPQLQNLLITMGGVDQPNATGKLLGALQQCSLPEDFQITVVMGGKAPWLEQVRMLAANMPCPTKVLVNVNNMAQLMADSDLAIGAAGSTSWERCCLGLPTVIVVLAENQEYSAKLLVQAQAVKMLPLENDPLSDTNALLGEIMGAKSCLPRLAKNAKVITDGNGCLRVIEKILTMEISDE